MMAWLSSTCAKPGDSALMEAGVAATRLWLSCRLSSGCTHHRCPHLRISLQFTTVCHLCDVSNGQAAAQKLV